MGSLKRRRDWILRMRGRIKGGFDGKRRAVYLCMIGQEL